jgi:hypothetical protein
LAAVQFYTIALQIIDPDAQYGTPADPDEAHTGVYGDIAESWERRGHRRVLRVDPYGILPDSGYAFLPDLL